MEIPDALLEMTLACVTAQKSSRRSAVIMLPQVCTQWRAVFPAAQELSWYLLREDLSARRVALLQRRSERGASTDQCPNYFERSSMSYYTGSGILVDGRNVAMLFERLIAAIDLLGADVQAALIFLLHW